MRAPAVRALALLRGAAVDAPDGPTEAGPVVHSLGRPAPRGERQRRATRECLLGCAAVEAMLGDAGTSAAAIAGERTALVYATAAAYAPSNRAFIEGSGGSIHFPYTAPAAVAAEVAIEFGVTGPYAIFIGGPPTTLRAIWQAAALLESGACDRALVLALEVFDECRDLYRRACRRWGGPLVEAAGSLWLEPGHGRLEFESRRARQRPPRGAASMPGGMFGCEPLAAVERWRSAAGSAPLEVTGVWRGEHARLAWREDPAVTHTSESARTMSREESRRDMDDRGPSLPGRRSAASDGRALPSGGGGR